MCSGDEMSRGACGVARWHEESNENKYTRFYVWKYVTVKGVDEWEKSGAVRWFKL